MLPYMPKGFLTLLLVTRCILVHSQTASPSPEPKSVVEQIKEQTISYHTGVNVTAAVNNTTETLHNMTGPAAAPAPLTMPAQVPAPIAAPRPSASVPDQAPHLAPSAAAPSRANSSAPPPAANSTTVVDGLQHSPASPIMTPAATPLASASASDILTNTTGVNVTEIAASAKDATVVGASVVSSQYGSTIAGTLVAAVMIVGLAGTVVVWRHRSANTYQGLHDTELAMIRREH